MSATWPAWLSVINLSVTLVLASFVWLLWRSVRRLWQRDSGFEDISGSLLHLTSRLNSVERDVQNVRHDVNAIGHTLGGLEERFGTDIVESEERIVAQLKTIADAQVVMMQELSQRPCIVRENEVKELPCPEGEGE